MYLIEYAENHDIPLINLLKKGADPKSIQSVLVRRKRLQTIVLEGSKTSERQPNLFKAIWDGKRMTRSDSSIT